MVRAGFLVLGLAAVSLVTTHAARAETYDVSFSDSANDSGTLVLTTDSNNPATIMSATGNFYDGINHAADTITGLLGVNAYAGNDNLFYPTDPVYFDLPGVSFSVSGGFAVNLSADFSDTAYLTNSKRCRFGRLRRLRRQGPSAGTRLCGPPRQRIAGAWADPKPPGLKDR